MTTLREKMSPHLTKAFSPEMYGQVVSYAGENINAIVISGDDPQQSRQGSSATSYLQVMKSDVPVWAVGDAVAIDGVSWKVKREGLVAGEGSDWFKTVLVIETDRRLKP